MEHTEGKYFELIAMILIYQAILFAALFGGIYQKTKHYPKKFIAWYMLVNAAFFVLVWSNYFGHYKTLRFLYPLSMPLLISFLPLFYYYFRSLTTIKYRVKAKQWYHLLPPVIVLLLQLPYYLFPERVAWDFVLHKPVTDSYKSLATYLVWVNRISFYGLFTLQFLFYLFKFRTNLKLHRLRLELMFSYKENLDLGWMKKLFIGILVFFLSNDITYFFQLSHPWFSVMFYCIGMLLINFYIGYHSLIQSEMVENEIIARMTHYCALHREMTKPRSEMQEDIITQELQKYQRSALKDEAREQILQKLDSIMKEEQLFTDSQISLEELAMKLNTNSKHLSQTINEGHQKNFFNYINDLRIQKAKEMLQTESHANLSIEGIAREVGFQSKSSFYTAFKKATGVTPTEFKSQLNELEG